MLSDHLRKTNVNWDRLFERIFCLFKKKKKKKNWWSARAQLPDF